VAAAATVRQVGTGINKEREPCRWRLMAVQCRHAQGHKATGFPPANHDIRLSQQNARTGRARPGYMLHASADSSLGRQHVCVHTHHYTYNQQDSNSRVMGNCQRRTLLVQAYLAERFQEGDQDTRMFRRLKNSRLLTSIVQCRRTWRPGTVVRTTSCRHRRTSNRSYCDP